MTPPLMLDRPVSAADGHQRAVGNDGLTDAQREEYAAAYRAGCARQPGEQALRDVAAWLKQRRGGSRLA